ncbi:MAG: NTP transferase domain-containing protein, partial [Actinomycetota bacterium]
ARTGLVVVAPCDHVLLRGDDVRSLIDAAMANPERAAVATRNGEPQVSLAVWPAVRGRALLRLVDEGVRAFRAALDIIDWVGVPLPDSALADADTPEDLTRLLAKGTD